MAEKVSLRGSVSSLAISNLEVEFTAKRSSSLKEELDAAGYCVIDERDDKSAMLLINVIIERDRQSLSASKTLRPY